MFALLHNLYKYVREKSERRVTLVILGVDNAGKTTLLNTLQGEHDKETSPTFGFNSSTKSAHELGLGGKSLILQVFDLGGGQSIRRVWKSYLAEVHGVVFVVDAADATRFAECQQVLHQTVEQKHLQGKPILVLANKQDITGAASSAEVADQLGLTDLKSNDFHIKGCTAKRLPDQPPDPQLHEGMRWLLNTVGAMFPKLDARVQQDAAEVKEEDLRRKKDREERARKIKEERLQQQKADEEAEERRKAEEAAAAEAAAKTDLENGVSPHEEEVESGSLASPGLDKPQPVSPVLPGGIESPTLRPITLPPNGQSHHFGSPQSLPNEDSVTFCPLAAQPSPHLTPSSSSRFPNGMDSSNGQEGTPAAGPHHSQSPPQLLIPPRVAQPAMLPDSQAPQTPNDPHSSRHSRLLTPSNLALQGLGTPQAGDAAAPDFTQQQQGETAHQRSSGHDAAMNGGLFGSVQQEGEVTETTSFVRDESGGLSEHSVGSMSKERQMSWGAKSASNKVVPVL